jgi:hypothetical protein
MPLDAADIEELVAVVGNAWNPQRLGLFARDLGVDLDKEAPSATMKVAVRTLVRLMREDRREEEFLAALQSEGNQAIKTVVAELERPDYFSPSGDKHDAIVLGRRAFVDRDDLRDRIRAFTQPDAYSTHMLVVRGREACGKSYSWYFLDHLARTSGATPQTVSLKGLETPRELVEEVFAVLDLDQSKLPAMADAPQRARMRPLVAAFKGQIRRMAGDRYWLVFDDVNDPDVEPPVDDAAFALAEVVEETRPERLWVALLGYNSPIAGEKLRLIAQDDPQFPDPDCLAKHFELLAAASTNPLAAERAREVAEVLFSEFPVLDKAAMTALTPKIERMGEKLRRGEQPFD